MEDRDIPSACGALRNLRNTEIGHLGCVRGQTGKFQDLDEVGAWVGDEGAERHWEWWEPYLFGLGTHQPPHPWTPSEELQGYIISKSLQL